MGVLMNVATNTMTKLPKIALASPPACPGGGVICVKSVGDSASKPADEQRRQDPEQEHHAEHHRAQRHHEVEAVDEQPPAIE